MTSHNSELYTANDTSSNTPDNCENLDLYLQTLGGDQTLPSDDFLYNNFPSDTFNQLWQESTTDNGEVHPDKFDESFQLTTSDEPSGPASTLDDLDHNDTIVDKHLDNSPSAIPGKIGARFSSCSVGILRTWLSQHSKHPYPTVRDMEKLQKQTGLSKQQISNWLANSRRRSKFKVSRPNTTYVRSTQSPSIEIPRRRGSPAFFENMNPLQRWQNSPPEQEAAPFSAIANAVSNLSSATNSPYTVSSMNDGPANSIYNGSSAGSAGTSNSSRSSLASAYSYASRSSLRSPIYGRKEGKHRRRRVATKLPEQNALARTSHTYQCTFCAETFKTKHNWQRHEKSFHLSLERWECCPDGPVAMDSELRRCCVFCGKSYPDKEHLATHNATACLQRRKEDRTFYRKDHLQQHLKLVHDTKFSKWPMEKWKYENQEIRSRCGFCGLTMSSWSDRADHLAEHFKDGKTMIDWHGDWGFEDSVLDMVENSMPPYLIHYERNSPWPFTTKQGIPDSPTSAYELIEVELEYFLTEHMNLKHTMPSNQELQYESCCIIFGSEMLSKGPATSSQSWLRELLMSSEEITQQARIRPMKSAAKSRITRLKINGKNNIFEGCTAEDQLRTFAEVCKLAGSDVRDEELQREACNIVDRMEAASSSPSKLFVSFLTSLIWKSTHWLVPFRRRENLTLAESLLDSTPEDMTNLSLTAHEKSSELIGNDISSINLESPDLAPAGDTNVSAPTPSFSVGNDNDDKLPNIATKFLADDNNCYRRLSRELLRFVARTVSARNPESHVPTDQELQYQARWIMYEDDDPWNQTPADNPNWLRQFKHDVGLLDRDPASSLRDLVPKNV
ncbi:hypothetical protein F4810DRAFT_654606 [Camillea tinctor]|nr:hypothetical protein F4810DRAFT_654606 [Camillea tinctor]